MTERVLVLVSMPWHAVDLPSLPLGLLRQSVRIADPDVRVEQVFGTLAWAEFVSEQTSGRIGIDPIKLISSRGVFNGVGDWVFAGALDATHVPDDDYIESLSGTSLADLPLRHLYALAAPFVEEVVDGIVHMSPTVVGFSTTFMQNVPSLAAARLLKQRLPDVPIIFGGGNCDGPQGAALARNFPFIDVVVSGEGERALPQVLRALGSEEELLTIPGVTVRTPQGIATSAATCGTLDPDEIPLPDYDAYFDAVNRSPLEADIDPFLVMEASRGCWWGQRKHCTFCGLNGATLKFRSKPGQKFVQDLHALSARHHVLDVVMVDNILDNSYFESALPILASEGYDYRIHFEVKSNLTRKQIRMLREAGVPHVQPGIENLNSRVLKLMRKGVSGVANVRTLRDCDSEGVTVSWNYLYGFPGETFDDYADVIRQLPILHHLQPPSGASRIVVERFSPYFNDPSLGFPNLKPDPIYKHIYGRDDSVLHDMLYLWSSDPSGLQGEEAQVLHDAIERWRNAYLAGRYFFVRRTTAGLAFEDGRTADVAAFAIEDPLEVAAIGHLADGLGHESLGRALRKDGFEISDPILISLTSRFAELGLVFYEADRFIAVATEHNPAVFRIPAFSSS